MLRKIDTLGFGGNCHWCTEAIFQSLKGVINVRQGWIASISPADEFSEAVLVDFDTSVISAEILVDVHLNTHSCTSDHKFRSKYRSAVYVLNKMQITPMKKLLVSMQHHFPDQIITQILPIVTFRENTANFLNYYYSDTSKPFCENVINPKLLLLLKKFSSNADVLKISGAFSDNTPLLLSPP